MITEQRLAEIEARHATNPIWQWFNRASHAYWGFAGRVAGYFPQALGRVRSTNPFVGIARLTFVFVAGFIIVPPLYLVLGPFVQIVIVIIAVIWTCLAGVFGWHRPSAAQLAESIAQGQRAAQKPIAGSIKTTHIRLFLAEARQCATVMSERAIYLQRGLASYSIPDSLYARSIQLCCAFVDTPQEIFPELDELEQLLTSPSLDESMWADVPVMILKRLWLVIPEIDKLLRAFESESASYPDCGRAALMIARSTDQMLDAFRRTQAIAEQITKPSDE